MKKRTKKILAGAAAVAVVLGVAWWNASGASAQDAAKAAVKPDCVNLMYPLCNRSISAAQVVDNSLPGYKKLVPGSVSEDRLSQAVQDKLNKADQVGQDVLGGGISKSCDPVVIAHIGGSFKTGKTLVCSLDLPAGKWMLNTSAFFARTAAGVAGTRPQLAARVGASDTVFGDDYGTILGAEISPTKDRELTGSATKVVDGGVTVEWYAFGYNDDTSSAGSGDITAAADIVAVRVG